MRYAWIDRQVGQYPLSLLCCVVSVSVNGYRAWKRGGAPGRTRLTDTQLLTLIHGARRSQGRIRLATHDQGSS